MVHASINYQKAAIDRGYTDRLLMVDLSTKQISVESISEKMRAMFVGGRGYCLKLVYDGTTATTQYDSLKNV